MATSFGAIQSFTTSGFIDRPTSLQIALSLHISSTSTIFLVVSLLHIISSSASATIGGRGLSGPNQSLLSSSNFRSAFVDGDAGQRHGRRSAAAVTAAVVTAGSRETVLNLFVLEELNRGSFVGSIVRSHGLDRRHAPDVIGSLRFRLLSRNSVLLGTAPDDFDGESDAQNNEDLQEKIGESDEGRLWWFTVGELDGIIRTGRFIDREILCPRAPSCYITFDVVVQPVEYFQIIKVRVEILDTNDNEPSFPVPSKSIELSEAAEPDTSFLLPLADDLDSIKNGIVRYEMRPPTPAFQLLVVRKETPATVTGSSSSAGTADSFRWTPASSGAVVQLRLVLQERIDRETVDHIRFTVVAIDAGDPVRSGSLFVDIKVTDVNDNGPQFAPRSRGSGNADLTPPDARLSESAPIGTAVFRVVATDPDEGPNGELTYEFAQETVRDYGTQFTIDPRSGQIWTRSTFDHERQTIYVLYVVASDNGVTERKSVQTSVIVRVDDVNDNAPRVRANGLTNAAPRPEINNGSESGSFVAHLTIDDPDTGSNGRFSCRVSTGSELFELRQMYATEFKVIVAPRVKIMVGNPSAVIRLAVTCSDHGVPELTSTLALEVAVVSRNDRAPTFGKTEYRFEVAENSVAGTIVGRVDATDVDSGPGGHVTFRVAEADGVRNDRRCPIEVGRETGALTISEAGVRDGHFSLDRELVSSCELFVVASDNGQPSRSSRARVVVQITDLDDEPVRFQSSDYLFTVSENQPTGTEVGKVSAVDADLPPNNEVTYFIIEERRFSEPITSAATYGSLGELASSIWNEADSITGPSFIVDHYTGRINTIAVLDREVVPHYVLRVVASSTCRGVTSSATTIVAVGVTDLNDNAPVFVFPADSFYDERSTGTPSKSSEVSNVVVVALDNDDNILPALRAFPLATAKAVDRDEGPNAEIEYRLSFAKIASKAVKTAADSATVARMFDVDPRTGEIRLSGNVDWTSQHVRRLVSNGAVLELELTATDGARTPDSAIGHATTGRLLILFRRGVDGSGLVPDGGVNSLHRRDDDDVLINVLSSEQLAVVLACVLAVILVVISIVVATICLFRTQNRRRQQCLNDTGTIKIPPLSSAGGGGSSIDDPVDGGCGKLTGIGGLASAGSERMLVQSSTKLAGFSSRDPIATDLNGTVRVYDIRQNGRNNITNATLSADECEVIDSS